MCIRCCRVRFGMGMLRYSGPKCDETDVANALSIIIQPFQIKQIPNRFGVIKVR